MKLTVKGIPIEEVESWNIDTITESLSAARERFRLTSSEADAKECERLYGLQKQFKKWGAK